MAIAKPSTVKTWKYLSITLMGILATGFLFPHAFAAPIDTVLSLVQQISAKIDAIKAKTDNLPSDPASQSITGKPSSSHMQIFEGETTTIVSAPAAGFERSAILTLSSNGDTIADIGHKVGGSTTFVQNSNLEAFKSTTMVADVPAGKELAVSIADDGDQFTDSVRVTVIWWESAAG